MKPGDGPVWVIDPIDGTKSFVTGLPLFGTLIALIDGGRPVVGVIDMPALGERWTGRPGQALFGGAPARPAAAARSPRRGSSPPRPMASRGRTRRATAAS